MTRRTAGALAAAAISIVIVALIAEATHGGVDASATVDLVAIIGISGWLVGPRALGGRGGSAVAAAFAFSLVATFLTITMGWITWTTKEAVLGDFGVFELALHELVWVLCGFLFWFVVFIPIVIVLGFVWVAIMRLAGRLWVAPSTLDAPDRPSALAAIVLTVLVAITTGAWSAWEQMPPGATCLDLGGEQAEAVAWSPDGTSLAIASTSDPDVPATVRLLRRSDFNEMWRTSAWVDDWITLDDHGAAYWVSFELGLVSDREPVDGLLTASAGSPARPFSTGRSAILRDVAWTKGGLVGVEEDGRSIERLADPAAGASVPLTATLGLGGAFWVSPDSSWIVSTEEWGGNVQVVGPQRTWALSTADDFESVSMDPDHSAVIGAGSSGVVRYPLDGSPSRSLVAGYVRQVRVSSQGDVAWVTDSETNLSRACMAPLGRLGG
jgi:hypothetical protein